MKFIKIGIIFIIFGLASHIIIPKEKWDKYHEPFKDVCKENILASNEIQVHTVESVLPAAYFEEPPFPVRIKEHSMITTVVHKCVQKACEPEEQVEVEPQVAMVKDLVTENID